MFVDATEQPVNRPGNGQRRYYGGKRRRHTVKHQVVVVRKRKPPGPAPAGRAGKRRKVRVAAVPPAYGGRTHDKRVYQSTRTTRPPGVAAYGDLGYRGTALRTPHRRPPKGTPTRRQRRGNRRLNRRLNRRRVAAEHGIGKMKVWRIAADRYRNVRRRHTPVMKNVAGLHNLMYA